MALLALGVLLIGVAVGVEAYRFLFARQPRERPAELAPLLLPAREEAPPPVEEDAPAPRREAPAGFSRRPLTVPDFFTAVADRLPKPLAGRFLSSFKDEPALRQALVRVHDARGADAPARELLRELIVLPEFRRLMADLERDPAFRRLVLEAAGGGGARGSPSDSLILARGAGLREAEGPARKRPPRASARPDKAADGSARTRTSPGRESSATEDSPEPSGERPVGRTLPEDGAVERRIGPPHPEAHSVPVRLARIKRGIPDKDATRALPSAFAAMNPKQLAQLTEACEDFDLCDPVFACQVTGLWRECVAACRKSGGKCPPQLLGRR